MHPERFTRAQNADQPVLIVGAGPAGMECATVLARRGFEQVHLVDAHRQMGGHMRWFSKLPGFNPWGRAPPVARRSAQRGDVCPQQHLDADGVLDYGGAIVIIATGAPSATQARNQFDGTLLDGADASLPFVLTPEQLLVEGKMVPGKRVVVYDCDAALPGPVTQHLLAAGHEVSLASPFADIAMRAHQDGVSFALRGEILAAGGG